MKGRAGEPLPIYGTGKNVRDWIHVEDHAAALQVVASEGCVGETYNIGAHNEHTNLDVAQMVCAYLDELHPSSPHAPHDQLISFVPDRPGHDFRYGIDASKVMRELNWSPDRNFGEGLKQTVAWYLANEDWCTRAVAGSYSGERLGYSFRSA